MLPNVKAILLIKNLVEWSGDPSGQDFAINLCSLIDENWPLLNPYTALLNRKILMTWLRRIVWIRWFPPPSTNAQGEQCHQLVNLIDDINGLYRIPSQGGLHLAENISGCTLTLSNKLVLSDVGVYPSPHFSQKNNSDSLLFVFEMISTEKIQNSFFNN